MKAETGVLGRGVLGLGVLGLGALGAALGLTGCSTSSPAAQAAATGSAGQSTAAAPAVTKTVVQTVSAAPPSTASAPAASTPAAQPPAAQPPAAQPAAPPGGPDVTDPWAVVSAYYGDIESGNYAQAFALIGNGATTGQSYQQFAAGYSCTGGETVSENWESGDQVNFNITAVDTCAGTTQYYTGTDTVENGTIVAADITQTG
jgi:hypothetical protein